MPRSEWARRSSAGALQTPDGGWRVEIVRRADREFFRLIHGDNVAALMSFAWFLVASFTLYMVAWLLHGHAAWLTNRDSMGDVEDA